MKSKTLLLFIACINFFNAQNNGLPQSDYYYIYKSGGGVFLGIDVTKSEQNDTVFTFRIIDEEYETIYTGAHTFVNNKVSLFKADGKLLYTIRFDRNKPGALQVYNLANKELYTARYSATTEKEEQEQKNKLLYLSEFRTSMKSCQRLYSFESLFIGIRKITLEEMLISVLSENGAIEMICKKSRSSGDSITYAFQDELDAIPLEFTINDKSITSNYDSNLVFESISVEALFK